MLRLKELRKSNNKTQKEIAEVIQTTQSNYGKYELEQQEPNIETLKLLADYYGVSVDYLIGHKTDSLDISFYSATAKQIVDMLPQLNNENLKKLCSVVEGLILGQK
ncbi:MAG: helix-turn-helix domain-containing protein [Christensenellales bacterium]